MLDCYERFFFFFLPWQNCSTESVLNTPMLGGGTKMKCIGALSDVMMYRSGKFLKYLRSLTRIYFYEEFSHKISLSNQQNFAFVKYIITCIREVELIHACKAELEQIICDLTGYIR